ncbi:hypothetical protein DBR42_21420, partial [Pelomonas sp. HMWF004]
MSIQTPTLFNNQAGLISARDIGWTGTALDNRAGSITAGQDLTLDGQSTNNDSGTLSAIKALGLTTPVLSNAGGSILAGQSLQLTLASSTSLAGTVSSSGDLGLSIQGDYTNAGQLSAARDLSIRANNISNSGTLHATRDLTVSARSAGAATPDGMITNTGELSAGGNTTLNAATLNHSGSGVIDATGTTTLNVGTLNNSASIYGGAIAAQASNAFNNSGAGSIMSRGDLSVIAPVINNTGGALLYAGRDMSFGSASGASQTLTNAGSRIEANGNLFFYNTAVSNLNVGLTTATQTTTSATAGLYYKATQAGFDSSQWLDTATLRKLVGAIPDGNGGLRVSGWVLDSTTYSFDRFGWNFYQEAYTTAQCGRPQDGFVDCSHANYAFDDPVWARFNVPSPALRPVPPTPPGGCQPGDASAECVALDDYNAAVRQDYANLQSAFNAFNSDLALNRASDTWLERQVTSTTTTETVLTNAGQAGQILAGGNITLAGSSSILNDSSQLVAGGSLLGNVTGVTNKGVQGTRTVATSGTEQGYYQYSWGGGCCS